MEFQFPIWLRRPSLLILTLLLVSFVYTCRNIPMYMYREGERASDVRVARQLIWVTAINELYHSGICYWQVAVQTALENAPSVFPVVLYTGNITSLQDAYRDTVVFIPFVSAYGGMLRDKYPAMSSVETIFARIESAGVISYHLQSGLLSSRNGLISSHFLYTDADVQFHSDVYPLIERPPKTVAFGKEFMKGSDGHENTGVLLINRTWLTTESRLMMKYGRMTDFQHANYDQGLLIDYMHDQGIDIDQLQDRYNYKAYWDQSPNISIVHWHGPKPLDACTKCIHLQTGTQKDFNLSSCSAPCPQPYLAALSTRDSDVESFSLRYKEYLSLLHGIC